MYTYNIATTVSNIWLWRRYAVSKYDCRTALVNLRVYLSLQFRLHFCLLCDDRTAAAKCTSVHLTFRCTPTTIARTQRSSRKDFSDFVRPRTATRRRVALPNRKRLIFTVFDPAAPTLSKINQTWVCAHALHARRPYFSI